MIRDRGLIKWTSMMLPEHVKMLREWGEEERLEEKWELDEQKIELLDEAAAEAMEFGTEVTVTYYDGGQYADITGFIHYADMQERTFRMVDAEGTVRKIRLEDIRDILTSS